MEMKVVDQFVREINHGRYSGDSEEELVYVLEDGTERTFWLGPKPESLQGATVASEISNG